MSNRLSRSHTWCSVFGFARSTTMALDITATAPSMFLVLLFIDVTLLIQTSMKVTSSNLGPFHEMKFFSLRMSLVPHGKRLPEC